MTTPPKARLVNLMNRSLRVYTEAGTTINIDPVRGHDMAIAQSEYRRVLAPSFALGVPVDTEDFNLLSEIPAPVDGVFYVVPQLVRKALPDRADLLSPGEKALDGGGRVVGCKNLVANQAIRLAAWGGAEEVSWQGEGQG